jgi:hypothetical protein
MEAQILLRDPKVFPGPEVLKDSLKEAYPVYEELLASITGPEYGLVPEWRFYNDGKAWLCKVAYKKKTIFWLSVWDEFFKVSFYFTMSTAKGVTDLAIRKSIRDKLISAKPIGKLIPLVVDIRKKAQLKDLLKLIDYKKSLK